jgi:CDP-6-deoxy-D-xylo-4-hexulose-3-dehydrase
MPEAIYDHKYVFNEIGYNLKPLELQAAMGLEQIKKLPEMDAARRKNHSRLNDIFKKYEEFFHLPEATPKSDPCWFAYLLTLKTDLFSRDDFVQHLEKAKIQTRSYFSGNILAHPGYHHLAKEGEIETFPVANKVTMDSFFLGTFIGLTDEKLDYIEEVVDDFFEKFYATFPNY